ncbi:hypothetical protein ACWJKQ_14570 [Xanthomonas axonopodis pv. cassiae]|uniref:hypothetical protein n=1 Tax=Xanthomonas axonopodis TaxID=53413 RepID=UPI0035575B36
MARLAESSVVIAFRDWQWLNRTADATVPPLMIVMEGNPESMLGDLQISAGERFFLFEVKSTEDTICEEWNKWDYKKMHQNQRFFLPSIAKFWMTLGNHTAQLEPLKT